jgi:hypothetical protein
VTGGLRSVSSLKFAASDVFSRTYFVGTSVAVALSKKM